MPATGTTQTTTGTTTVFVLCACNHAPKFFSSCPDAGISWNTGLWFGHDMRLLGRRLSSPRVSQPKHNFFSGCFSRKSRTSSLFFAMKTCKNLFQKISSFGNLLLAAHKAAKGKRENANVLNFFF